MYVRDWATVGDAKRDMAYNLGVMQQTWSEFAAASRTINLLALNNTAPKKVPMVSKRMSDARNDLDSKVMILSNMIASLETQFGDEKGVKSIIEKINTVLNKIDSQRRIIEAKQSVPGGSASFQSEVKRVSKILGRRLDREFELVWMHKKIGDDTEHTAYIRFQGLKVDGVIQPRITFTLSEVESGPELKLYFGIGETGANRVMYQNTQQLMRLVDDMLVASKFTKAIDSRLDLKVAATSQAVINKDGLLKLKLKAKTFETAKQEAEQEKSKIATALFQNNPRLRRGIKVRFAITGSPSKGFTALFNATKSKDTPDLSKAVQSVAKQYGLAAVRNLWKGVKS